MFDIADIWATRTGNTVRLTSANDHLHTRGSAHYAGRALDLLSSDPDGLAAAMRHAGTRSCGRCRAITATCTCRTEPAERRRLREPLARLGRKGETPDGKGEAPDG